MAESKLQNSSTKISKEKKSIIDDDFGKEFLSSWKSKDDSLDFGPNTVSTGKKKAFNFGNLDMDFDLGGDFDKFSSFKVDVPDIDFASPATKAVPTKETSAGSSGATSRKNRDAIFSFDFNEFDNFRLDSSLTIDTEKPVRNVNNKRVNSESSECQETRDPKFKHLEINEAADNDQNRKPDLPTADNGTTSFVESGANCEETANFSDDVTALLRTSGESLVSHEEAPKIIIPTDQLPDSSDVAIEGETNGKQTLHIISAQPSGGQDFIIRNGSDVETNYLPCDAKTDSWHGLVDETTEVSCPDDAMKLPYKNPISLTSVAQENNERKRASGDPIQDSMETEPSPNDINYEASCISSLSCGGEIKKGVQTSAPKCLTSVGIEAAGDSVIAGKKTESTITETRDFKMVKETERQVCQSPLSDIELPAPGKKGVVALQLSCSTNQRDPEATRRNLAGNSSSAAQEMAGKPAFPERKKNAISLGNMRKVLNTGGLQKGCKLVDNLRIADTETDKGEAVVLGGIKSIKPFLLKSNKKSSPSSVDKPSELNHKMTSSSRIGLSRMGWNSNSKVITAEGLKSGKTSPVLSNMKISGNEKSSASSVDKPSELNHKTTPSTRIGLSRMGMNSNSRLITVEDSKSGKTLPELSNLKISGTVESIHDKSPLLLKSESNLSRNWLIKEGKVNLLPMSLHPVFNADRKSPASMKRKISEVSKEDAEAFNSPKRLSPSLNESRIQNNCSNFKPTASSSVVENQVHSRDDLAGHKIKCVLYDHSTSSWETPGVNVKELEITSDLEDKGNVEKAEAYGKELDDICCMLKKKHEEAKELLVRAIVNNNSLLMLNHPMLDEKIRLVQKFAARLALTESCTEEVRVP